MNLQIAHALSQARSFGWSDIHPCFWDKLKSSFREWSAPSAGNGRVGLDPLRPVLAVTFPPAPAIDAQCVALVFGSIVTAVRPEVPRTGAERRRLSRPRVSRILRPRQIR
jgi:hypothetical protein